jgi:DNA-binding response OmpR family regulator
MTSHTVPPPPELIRILVVEDEPELQETIANLLREQGYGVTVSFSAEEALRKVDKEMPDLVLIDIKLPGIDGFDLFQEFKKMPAFASTPVVFLTAFNSLQAAMAAKQEGAAEYITKPFDLEYLLTVVRGLVPPR